ncbi:MAG: porin [Bacteroidota bacterium]
MKTLLSFFFLSSISLYCLSNNNSDSTKNVFSSIGKIQTKIFSNYHTSLNDNENNSGFEITRAYFGYKYQLSENFSTELKIDMGDPNDGGEGSNLRRYAYFKTASLCYEAKKIMWNFGIIELTQFKLQENFWGHRYITRSYQEEYGFGTSADIGSGIFYKPVEKICIDFVVMNSEGYTKLQGDETYKVAMGISYLNKEGLTGRLYCDYSEKATAISTFSGFIGYAYKQYASLGIESSLQKNYDYSNNQNIYGFSTYCNINFSEKWQLFGRYDYLNSNQLQNMDYRWNISKNGQALITGIQYSPLKNIRIAANYQHWEPTCNNIGVKQFFYLNFEYQVN